MPWCPECDRFLSPATVTPDGHCPRCGRPVDPGKARPAAETTRPVVADATDATDAVGAEGVAGSDETLPVPWHFKLLVAAIVLYLGYRAFEGLEWLVRQV